MARLAAVGARRCDAGPQKAHFQRGPVEPARARLDRRDRSRPGTCGRSTACSPRTRCTSCIGTRSRTSSPAFRRVTKPGAVLAIYGPFRYGGSYTSASNDSFDKMLHARDPASGIRDFETDRRASACRGILAQGRLSDACEQPDPRLDAGNIGSQNAGLSTMSPRPISGASVATAPQKSHCLAMR